MRIAVIDIGCSNVKVYIYQDSCGSLVEIWNDARPTPETATGIMVSVLKTLFNFKDIDQFIVLSYGDAVWSETVDGEIVRLPVQQSDFHSDLPKYIRSGKPRDAELKGIGNQLLHFADTQDLRKIKRILPCSAFAASLIVRNADWNTWDWGHASNSGMYDWQKGCWLPEMTPFIEAGLIDEKIVAPLTRIPSAYNMSMCVGSMDTLFAASNDLPYSTKPYLSCGTWVTASVESDIDCLKPGSKRRFVLAPNGVTLEQICFRASGDKERVANRINKFFRFKMKRTDAQIRMFGPWAEELKPYLDVSDLEYVCVERSDYSYLHYQSAKYAYRASDPSRLANIHVVNDPFYSCLGA